jgi:hypothetical protein
MAHCSVVTVVHLECLYQVVYAVVQYGKCCRTTKIKKRDRVVPTTPILIYMMALLLVCDIYVICTICNSYQQDAIKDILIFGSL